MSKQHQTDKGQRTGEPRHWMRRRLISGLMRESRAWKKSKCR